MAALVKMVAKAYQKNVHASLAKYGLRYEDVIMAENVDVQRALKYIPKEELTARNQRLLRATDMNFKHEYLPKEIQAVQEPGKRYLEEKMTVFRKLREERELLK